MQPANPRFSSRGFWTELSLAILPGSLHAVSVGAIPVDAGSIDNLTFDGGFTHIFEFGGW